MDDRASPVDYLAGRSDHVRLDDWVGEHRPCGAIELVSAKVTLDQEPAAGRDGPRTRKAQLGGVGGDLAARPVDTTGGGFDLEMPEHAGRSLED